jgi:hypothetical protein
MTKVVKQRIYISCPIAAYNSGIYNLNMQLIKARWPQAELCEAKLLYTSNTHWLAKWNRKPTFSKR